MSLETGADGIAGLIRYFRDCLLGDGGERELEDFLATGEKEHWLAPLANTPDGLPDEIVLPAAVGRRLAGLIQIQRQERQLLFGARIVCAPASEGEKGRIRAPLFLAEARLEERDGVFHAFPDRETLRLNPVALAALGLPRDWLAGFDPADSRLLEVEERLAGLPRLPPFVSVEAFPVLRGNAVRLADTAVLWLSERSRTAATTAFELDAIAAGADFSPCLQQMLGGAVRLAGGPAPVPESLPSRLSAAQEKALTNAASQTLSVIHGAPGTGKTYTIAGIVADRVMRGEKVLVVCGNEHAADVVHDKLAAAFAEAAQQVVRAGAGGYRQRLLQQLDGLLASGAQGPDESPRKAKRALRGAVRRQRRTAARFRAGLLQAESQGRQLAATASSFWRRLHGRWLAWRVRRRPLLAEVWAGYRQEVQEHRELARRTLEIGARAGHARLLGSHRRQLSALAVALRSRSSGHRSDRLEAIDWPTLTQAFPVWVVAAGALDRALPLSCGLFDLLIMDEATQCNLALALPALQRARRAVIVGDPQQLRHFSFLARARQEQLAVEHGVERLPISLDYRQQSLLDYAMNAVTTPAAQVWLDEHFRSHPELIEFSNRHFYDGRLKIVTDTRRLTEVSPRQIVRCPVRIEDDLNVGEIDTLLVGLRRLVEQSARLPAEDCPSIGVLALFSGLAQALQKRIMAEFDLATLTRHDLLVATPYGFQGEERDVMLLASGVFPGRSRAAWAYIERPDVFNVAITRARQRQIIHVPDDLGNAPASSLLVSYLNHQATGQLSPPDTAQALGAVRQHLLQALEALGCRCWIDFVVAGQSVDLLVQQETRVLAIDLIGADGAVGGAWLAERYALFERAGLVLMPLAHAEWVWRRDEVMAHIAELLGAPDESPERALQRRLAALRWRFDKLGDEAAAALLDALGQALEQALLWLARRFSVHELSYQRYAAGIERTAQSVIGQLGGLCLLLEEGRALVIPDDELQRRVVDDFERSRQAVDALAGLARKLALSETNAPEDLDGALAEIASLEKRLAAYRGTLSSQAA